MGPVLGPKPLKKEIYKEILNRWGDFLGRIPGEGSAEGRIDSSQKASNGHGLAMAWAHGPLGHLEHGPF